MSDVRKKNHIKAQRFLDKLVGSVAVGEFLPSIRTMVEDSGIGRRVLENSLATLLENNILESHNRQGIRKIKELPRKSRKIVVDIICCSEAGYLDSPNNFFAVLRDMLCFEATSNNCLIRMHQVKEDETLSAYEQMILDNDIFFAFLLAPHTIEIEKVFASYNVDTVTVLPRYQSTYSYSIIDSPNMTEIQMNHLLKLGHKNVAFIGEYQPQHANLTHMNRTLNYYRIMAENGFQVYPHWVIHSDYNNEEMVEKLSIMFHEKPIPTAVICCDMALTSLYHFLVYNKFQIGKDVSVISCDNLEHLRLFPEPTTVVNSRKIIAEMAWRTLEEIINNNSVPKIQYVPLSLKINESTNELKQHNYN